MEIKILTETGYEEALKGMSFSYYDQSLPIDTWWAEQRIKATRRATKLAHMPGGHNKFLEHIDLSIQIKASLTFWKHADTYRMATKQSESTMHTLKKRLPLGSKDFSKATPSSMIVAFNEAARLNQTIDSLADALPSGFLQTRIWKMSYKTLQNVIHQRKGHRLGDWGEFIYEILTQCQYPYYLLSYEELGAYDCKIGIEPRYSHKEYQKGYGHQYEKEAKSDLYQ